MARPTHFSWILPWICRMYQAYGKSETLRVSGPDPVADPDAAPSGGGGGAAAASRRVGVCGAVVGVVLAVWGSSFSVGRGGAGERLGKLRSGSPTEFRCGNSREGRSRAGRSRGASRVGSSGGGGLTGASLTGASSTRGAVGAARGEPMAATLGVSTTNTGFVRVSVHIEAPMMTIAKNATWAIADTTAGASGSRNRPNAGPMWKLARRATAKRRVSALPSRLGHHAESLDARATDAVHRLPDHAVREPRIGLEVQSLVASSGERLTQRALETVGRHAPVVQEERLVLGDREDHALLDGGRLRRGLRQVHVDPAVHHRGRQHEDQQQDEHDVDQRNDVDLGKVGTDPTRVRRLGSKRHLSPRVPPWQRAGSGRSGDPS